MKKAMLLAVIALTFTQLHAQKVVAYSADDVVRRTTSPDTVYIVNFWATWCIPCVKELPAFSRIQEEYKDKPVKVLLVSFDFKEQFPAKLQAWVARKKLTPEVVWFRETNPTEYIPKIAPEWEGGLPATLFISPKNKERRFKGEEITYEELKAWVDAQL